MNKKSGEETGLLLHFSKTDFRYWSENVFRKGYTKNGQRLYTKEWYARMQHDGRREFFPLQTPNKAAAAARATRPAVYFRRKSYVIFRSQSPL
jgi:hypothetical protein